MGYDLVTWLRAQLDRDDDRFRVGHAADAEWRVRDVAAKRRLIDLHAATVMPGGQVPDAIYCPTCNGLDWDMYPMPVGCATLRLLALPYSDREGYRDEWAS